MKNDSIKPDDDDLRPEYDSSELKGGVRGKYLERYCQGTNLALLAPDVPRGIPDGRGRQSGIAVAVAANALRPVRSFFRERRSAASQSPSTSFMPYSPGGLPARNLAAARAPRA